MWLLIPAAKSYNSGHSFSCFTKLLCLNGSCFKRSGLTDRKAQIWSDLGTDLSPWTQGRSGAELGQRPVQQGRSPLHTIIATSLPK